MDKSTPTPRIITFDAWYQVNDCPIQRNTENHARLASKKHLSESAATHSSVNAAELPDGTLYKLDGHTRSFLWQKGLLEKPSAQLVMMTYRASDIEEVKELYKQFDNASAMESGKDKVSGIYRDMGLTPQSGAVEYGGIVSALKLIFMFDNSKSAREFDVYEELPKWKLELLEMDALSSNTLKMTTPVIAAFLITNKLHGNKSKEFWHNYANDLGIKRNGSKDGVQSLTETIETRKHEKRNQGQANYKDILSRAIACYEIFQRNKYLTKVAVGIDVAKYLDRNNFFKD